MEPGEPGDPASRRLSLLLMEMGRRLASSGLSGAYCSHFRGAGWEFAELQEYHAGDDSRLLAWQASLRSNHLYRRSFQEEREIPLLLVADVSASICACPAVRQLQLETAAVLALCAQQVQDPCGLLAFSTQPELQLPPRRGGDQTRRILSGLEQLQPQRRQTDVAGCLECLASLCTRPARLFLLSDFPGEMAAWRQLLRRLSLRHELLLGYLEENIEEPLPPGLWLPAEETESGRRGLLSAAAAKERGHLQAVRRQQLRQLAEDSQVGCVCFTTDRRPEESLLDYFQGQGKLEASRR